MPNMLNLMPSALCSIKPSPRDVTIDCIDYVIQAPGHSVGHSVLRVNTFSMGSCWAAG